MKAPAKVVCLEGYWNERVFQSFSVKGFFEAMAPLSHPSLSIAHRFVESEAGLAYYAKRPDIRRRGATCGASSTRCSATTPPPGGAGTRLSLAADLL